MRARSRTGIGFDAGREKRFERTSRHDPNATIRVPAEAKGFKCQRRRSSALPSERLEGGDGNCLAASRLSDFQGSVKGARNLGSEKHHC